MVEKAHT